MRTLLDACRQLYQTAFAEETLLFGNTLFEKFAPRHLCVIEENGKPLSMLFSIPYPIQTKKGILEARYLYAIATDPAARGKGLATKLLRQEMAKGLPLFLRPSSPSLFAFYQKVGFLPFSPMVEIEGNAEYDTCEALSLNAAAYLAQRTAFLTTPYATPTANFLSLHFLFGGAIGVPGKYAALYEIHNKTVLFKEWLGNPEFAPGAAAKLGALHYRLRTRDQNGTDFGMGAACPKDTTFLIALD